MENKYFDLHTRGLGYMGRVREVAVKRGGTFMACDISALHGSSDSVEYTKFDCRVSGQEAERVVKKAMQAANDRDRKVLVGFTIGDIYPEAFEYAKGEKAGTTGVEIKGRLLKVAFLKVDGETVYTAPKQAEVETAPAAAITETAEAEEADA